MPELSGFKGKLMEPEATAKSVYQAPRWAGFSTAMKNAAFELNLKLDLDIDKGFLTETGRFKVSGSEMNVRMFVAWFKQTCADFNK